MAVSTQVAGVDSNDDDTVGCSELIQSIRVGDRQMPPELATTQQDDVIQEATTSFVYLEAPQYSLRITSDGGDHSR